MGAPSRRVPTRISWMSSSISSSHSSSSIRSVFVRATRPSGSASRSRMARCSRVWGMTPSSAAMTRIAASMLPTPASMFLIKSIWPGTSTMLTASCEPSGMARSIQAKPSTIVSPRRCSSSSRSGWLPVSAWTSVDLPWSTCPAVAMTRIRCGYLTAHRRQYRRYGACCCSGGRTDRRCGAASAIPLPGFSSFRPSLPETFADHRSRVGPH